MNYEKKISDLENKNKNKNKISNLEKEHKEKTNELIKTFNNSKTKKEIKKQNKKQNNFENFKINEKIIKALSEIKITNPNPIQKKGIPEILKRKNTIIKSKPNSGKTLVFSMPVLNIINPLLKKTQAIILTPTHELAKQIFNI